MRQNRCGRSFDSSSFLSGSRSTATIDLFIIFAHKMSATKCFFCDQLNPDGARFCNECGSPLYLQQSSQDAAIDHDPANKLDGRAGHSEESTTTGLFAGLLYSEHAVDQTIDRGAMSLWRKPEPRSLSNGAAWLLAQRQCASEATLRASFPVKAGPRRGRWMAAAALALTMLAIPGYYVYLQLAGEKGLAESPGAGGELDAGRSPAVTSVEVPNGNGSPPAGQGSTRLTSPQEDRPLARAARPTDAAAAYGMQPGDSADGLAAKAVATPIAGHAAAPAAVTPKSTEPRSKPKQAAIKQGARVIAKGPRTEMPATSALAVPPATTKASIRPRRDAPSLGPCTEAVAALGLCSPGPKQGRE